MRAGISIYWKKAKQASYVLFADNGSAGAQFATLVTTKHNSLCWSKEHLAVQKPPPYEAPRFLTLRLAPNFSDRHKKKEETTKKSKVMPS